MRSLIFSILIYAVLICHKGYAFNKQEFISECLAAHELDVSVFGVSEIKDVRPSSYRYLFRSALDVNKRNCLAACIFQKAGIINDDGKFTDETIPKLYRNLPGGKVNACKDKQELCEVGGCLLDAIYNK